MPDDTHDRVSYGDKIEERRQERRDKADPEGAARRQAQQELAALKQEVAALRQIVDQLKPLIGLQGDGSGVTVNGNVVSLNVSWNADLQCVGDRITGTITRNG